MQRHRRFAFQLALVVAGLAWVAHTRKGDSVALDGPESTNAATLGPVAPEADAPPLAAAESQPKARLRVEFASLEGERTERADPSQSPQATTRVRVLDELSRPVVGARAESREHVPEARFGNRTRQLDVSAPTLLGATDLDGALEFPLERRAVFWVEAPDGRLGALLVHPGEDTTLQLEGPPRHATFLDEGTRAPVAGRTFPVSVRRGARSAAVLLATDERGRFALPCGACELIIGTSAPRVLLTAVEVTGVDGAAPVERAVVPDSPAVLTLAAADRDLIVLVRNDEHRLRLLDAATGAPIEGSVWLQTIFQDETSGVWRGVGAESQYPVVHGDLVVGSWFAAPLAPASDNVRWLALAGYEVARFGADVDLRGAEVRLERGPACALRLVDGEGRALGGRLEVATSTGPSYATRLEPGELFGPIPWTPGDSWQFRFAAQVEFRAVSSTELGAAVANGTGVVTVKLVDELGALVIEGVPSGAPPVFALAATRELREVPILDGRGTLASIPAGAYGVGTRAWLMASGSGSSLEDPFGLTTPPDRLSIRAGEELHVAWNDDWWERTEVRGEVTCDDVDAQELLVLPLTGSLERSVLVSNLSPWLPVDPNGRFTLPAGGARPTGFAFARYFDGWRGADTYILDVQRRDPSERYVVRTTSFELRAAEGTGTPSRVFFVRFVTDPAELSASAGVVGPSAAAWDPRAPLVVRGLPRNLRALRVGERGVRGTVEVPVQPGAFSRVEVTLPPATAEPPAERAEQPTFVR